VSWLNPGAAFWLLLVPALLALYMLRARPLRKRVSSLRLWETLPQVERPKAKLRRPPLSVLLFMQAILLLAGAIALTQPALTAPAGRQLVILLDASGSMQATGGGSTRFERAREEAGRLISAMKPEDRATLLRVGTGAASLCSQCSSADAQAALAEARVGAGVADMRAALGVAAGLARRAVEGSLDTYVISDGAFDVLPDDVLPAQVDFIQVGEPADNHAITALSARRPPDGSPGYTVYARLENKGASQAAVDVSALADTVPLPSRRLNVPAGGHADLVWDLPAGTARFTVSTRSQDALAADDRAALFLPEEGQHKVAIVAADPTLYERAISGIPGLAPVAGQDVPDAAFTIIEGNLPQTLPPGNLLLVNPQGVLLPSTDALENVRPIGGSAHPLLSGVDVVPLVVQKARLLEPVSWLDPVVQSAEGPLLLVGEREGQRIIVLAFDPRESNLPKLAAFPLLMANVVDWLYPLASVGALHPGASIRLSPGSTITTPNGQSVRVADTGVYGDTEEAGLYKVSSGGRETNFSVNMVNSSESSLSPREHPELDRPSSIEPVEDQTQQEVWSPLAALALVLVGSEWLFYCWRRGQS
jgi:Ca-activated chloride channel family protein